MPLPRRHLAAVALLLAVLAAAPAQAAPPARAPAPATTLRRAQAEADRVQRRVDALNDQVEALAEAYDAGVERLDGIIQASAEQQAALERTRAALGDARAGLDDEARNLYMHGPLAPFELLLAARDPIDVELARLAGRNALSAGQGAVTRLEASSGAAAALVGELQASQAQALELRRHVLEQAQAIQATLDEEQAVLAAARANVRDLMLAQQAREEAARRARLGAAASRSRALGLAGYADAPPPTLAAAMAVRTALAQVGKWYQWGATGPDRFDCSGLTQFAYGSAGTRLPRTSREQWSAGAHVDAAHLLPGDLVFWASDTSDPGTIHHVGMYLGQGLIVDAPHSGARVRVEPLDPDGYIGATRPTRAG